MEKDAKIGPNKFALALRFGCKAFLLYNRFNGNNFCSVYFRRIDWGRYCDVSIGDRCPIWGWSYCPTGE